MDRPNLGDALSDQRPILCFLLGLRLQQLLEQSVATLELQSVTIWGPQFVATVMIWIRSIPPKGSFVNSLVVS
jgi:hypothetical protein